MSRAQSPLCLQTCDKQQEGTGRFGHEPTLQATQGNPWEGSETPELAREAMVRMELPRDVLGGSAATSPVHTVHGSEPAAPGAGWPQQQPLPVTLPWAPSRLPG